MTGFVGIRVCFSHLQVVHRAEVEESLVEIEQELEFKYVSLFRRITRL